MKLWTLGTILSDYENINIDMAIYAYIYGHMAGSMARGHDQRPYIIYYKFLTTNSILTLT